MNIYIGNLAYSVTEDELKQAFTAFGEVTRATLITDKFTGQSKGFGFVEMATSEETTTAIAALNGTQLGGRTLTVNEARPQEPNTGRGNFGGGRNDRGGGRKGRW